MLLSRDIKCNVKTRMFSNCDVFSSQAQQAQKFREQQEELRRRHIDELRSKDMDRRAQVERHYHIHLYIFLPRLRKGGETLRSLSRSGGRRSWPGTRRGSPGWSRRGGTAGGTLSSPLAALLPGWWNPGWTQPQDIGAAGGKTEILGDF